MQRYALAREIGRGASGSVWVARDLHLGRHVAVKLLHPDNVAQPEAAARFEHEARMLAQLRSPHVVQVFDAGLDDGQPFIVMELLEGETLEERLAHDAGAPRTPREVAEIVAELARGLSTTHRVGLVHRDLKPANVFFAREHDRETLKLIDFGLADTMPRSDGSVHVQASFAGTPAYMSAEQFSNTVVDARADLWAFAVLTFELLTGTMPFAGDSLAELWAALQKGVYSSPSSLIAGIDPQLDAFFARAFSRVTTERFASAVEFATEFLKLTDGSSLTTRVLVLDDEPDIQLLLEQRFRRAVREERYSFVFASNGEAGLAELRRQPDIDVILTDINMPVMDGLTFLGKVPDVNPHVRVVVVSAYSDMLNIRAAMNRGAFDFICKPLDFSDLERTLERAAAATTALRRSHRIREEHDILRSIVGPRRADLVVKDAAIGRNIPTESFSAVVVALGMRECAPILPEGSSGPVFDRLSARVELMLGELPRFGAWIVRFQGSVALAVFRGPDALERATSACLAIRECRGGTDDGSLAEALLAPGICFGIAFGDVIVGGIGPRHHDGIEQLIFGEPCDRALSLQLLAEPNDIIVAADLEPKLASAFVLEVAPASVVQLAKCSSVRVVGHSPLGLTGSFASTASDRTLDVPPSAWAAGIAEPSAAPTVD